MKAAAHGRGLVNVMEAQRRAGHDLPNQMATVIEALRDGRIANLLLMGTEHAVVVCRQRPAERRAGARPPGGELRPLPQRHGQSLRRRRAAVHQLAGGTGRQVRVHAPVPDGAGAAARGRDAARHLGDARAGGPPGLDGFFPWASDEALVDAILDHPATGHATVAALCRNGGIGELRISPVANPTLIFDTPSRRIEFLVRGRGPLACRRCPSGRNPSTGMPTRRYPLTLTQGRTLAHFHGFYNNGRELPTLARREVEPRVWISTPTRRHAGRRRRDDPFAQRARRVRRARPRDGTASRRARSLRATAGRA